MCRLLDLNIYSSFSSETCFGSTVESSPMETILLCCQNMFMNLNKENAETRPTTFPFQHFNPYPAADDNQQTVAKSGYSVSPCPCVCVSVRNTFVIAITSEPFAGFQ